MAQLAIDMAQDGPGHPLKGAEAYFDGCYSQCLSYKILALFVYHPAMQHSLQLTTMEVKSESTHEISLFWELFNAFSVTLRAEITTSTQSYYGQ